MSVKRTIGLAAGVLAVAGALAGYSSARVESHGAMAIVEPDRALVPVHAHAGQIAQTLPPVSELSVPGKGRAAPAIEVEGTSRALTVKNWLASRAEMTATVDDDPDRVWRGPAWRGWLDPGAQADVVFKFAGPPGEHRIRYRVTASSPGVTATVYVNSTVKLTALVMPTRTPTVGLLPIPPIQPTLVGVVTPTTQPTPTAGPDDAATATPVPMRTVQPTPTPAATTPPTPTTVSQPNPTATPVPKPTATTSAASEPSATPGPPPGQDVNRPGEGKT